MERAFKRDELRMEVWRRSKIEVCLDVLRTIQREKVARPTRIMYKSNTAWVLLQSILNSFMKSGLIESVELGSGGRRAYRLTDEGRRAIEILEAACEITRKVGVK
ncbi:MAG: winged helix-turn-helix domain-containing protein [Thermoproteota archaeon]